MSEWKEYKLGEIASEIGDGLHGTPEYSDEGEYYFVNGNNIQNGKITIKNDTKKVGIEEFEQYKKPLSNRTLLLSINGTIGNVGKYNSERCILGKSACYINIKESFDKNFVYYMLRSNDFQIHLKNIATGTTIQNVPLKGLRESRIILPPIDEQKRIAGVLSSLDDKIDLLNRENATLEALAETLFRHYFIENPDPTWKEGKLGDYVKTTSGGTPSRKQSKYYTTGTIDWVKSKELNGTFIFDTEEKITEEAVYNSSAKFLPANSVLIAMYGATVGEYGILAHSMTCNQAVCALLPNDNYPYTYLLGWAICYKQDLINLATGAAQQNISQDLIKQQMVCTDYELIRIYDEQIKPYIAKIKSNQQQIQTLTTQRDTLLPCLISGEVKV